MDSDATGLIGVNELKAPLIGLGLVDSVYQVQDLINLIHEKNSGSSPRRSSSQEREQIDFDEFLQLIHYLANKVTDGRNAFNHFIKELNGGKFQKGGIPFSNWVLKE